MMTPKISKGKKQMVPFLSNVGIFRLVRHTLSVDSRLPVVDACGSRGHTNEKHL